MSIYPNITQDLIRPWRGLAQEEEGVVNILGGLIINIANLNHKTLTALRARQARLVECNARLRGVRVSNYIIISNKFIASPIY